MQCSACKKTKDKGSLYPKKSKLVPGVQLYLCLECKDIGREPRHLVIIGGRSNGIAFVSEYLRKRRYCGETIAAEDFV